MLDQFNTDYIIPENKFNSGVENEFDPKLRFIDDALDDLKQEIAEEDARVIEARELVENSYAEIVKPNPEINVEHIVRKIQYRGKNIEDARRYHIERTNKNRNMIEKIILKPTDESEIVEDIERKIGADIFQLAGFDFFFMGRWYTRYVYSDSYGTHEVVKDYNVTPNGILKSSSQFEVPTTYIYGKELIDFDQATATYHDRVLARYGYIPENIPQIPVANDIDDYSANKAA